MMEELWRRISALLAVKSVITVVLTAVFAVLALSGKVSGEQFLTIFTVVVGFYFGTQAKRE